MSDEPTCRRCGHPASSHRHDDELLDANCHGPDGNYNCTHFRCLFPWTPATYAPDPACDCPHFVYYLEAPDA